MEIDQQAMETLRSQGRRLTRQRQVILDILLHSQEHLDAERLYDLARAEDSNISLATVYRSLALFKSAGLVQEDRLGEGHGHFETTPRDPHYHFTCMKCGRVIEFAAPQVLEAAQELGQRNDLKIIQVHLHLTGYCAACRSSADFGEL
jgi:Fur family transcriptional regulator, ferric uptake regulator